MIAHAVQNYFDNGYMRFFCGEMERMDHYKDAPRSDVTMCEKCVQKARNVWVVPV